MRKDAELRPLTRAEQVVALAAIISATLAATVFVVVLVLGSGGATEVSRVFSPIAIVATSLAIVFSIWAVSTSRLRTVGVTTLIVAAPCLLLSFISILALTS